MEKVRVKHVRKDCTNGRVDGVCVLQAAYGEHLVESVALMLARLLKNTCLFRSACGLRV